MHFYKLFYLVMFCGFLNNCYSMQRRHYVLSEQDLEEIMSRPPVTLSAEDLDRTTVQIVVETSEADMVYDAVASGNIASVLDKINSADTFGTTSLHRAALFADKEMVELLLNHGADAMLKDHHGQTALHVAAGNRNSIEVLNFLLAHGADINAKDHHGQTALHAAAEHGKSIEVLNFLLAHGVDINALDYGLNTPLHLAAVMGNEQIVKWLIVHGASVDVKDATGRTPIFCAATWGRKAAVELLFDLGAHTDLQNNVNQRALDCAQRRRFHEIEYIVRSFFALEKGMSDTPMLKILIKLGDYPHLVHQLLAIGVRPTQKDLNLAQACEKKKIGKILKTYLGIISSNGAISKTGISRAFNLDIPEDIVALIAAYAVAE
jgi:ankyrin repeat protein